MTVRKRSIKPDPKGRYRPYLGYRVDGKQQRFNLGSDKAGAERRMNPLYELWAENIRVNGGESVWSIRAPSYALEVAKGRRRIEFPFTADLLEAEDPAAEYAQIIHVERERFPSLDIVPADHELYSEGVRRNEKLVGSEVSLLQSRLSELGALAPKQTLPSRLVAGKLHEALEAYADDDVRGHNVWPSSGELKQSGHRRLEMMARFKERHEDRLLSLLGPDKVKELIRYWCKRPPKKSRKTGKLDGFPISVSSGRHHRKELDRFFRWLDATEKFGWVLPRRFAQIDRSIGETEEEFSQRLTAIQKKIYTVEELATLNRHATPLERLCCFAPEGR